MRRQGICLAVKIRGFLRSCLPLMLGMKERVGRAPKPVEGPKKSPQIRQNNMAMRQRKHTDVLDKLDAETGRCLAR